MFKFFTLFKSFKYAIQGLVLVFKEEQNFRVHVISAIAVCVLGCFFCISALEWVAIILVIGLVMTAELINSAMERIIDTLKPRLHSNVKEVKDIMAGFVMLLSLVAVIIGLIIFLPKFLK